MVRGIVQPVVGLVTGSDPWSENTDLLDGLVSGEVVWTPNGPHWIPPWESDPFRESYAFQQITNSVFTLAGAALGAACFTEGTLVLGENGPIPIETVMEGDLVWAHDINSGEVHLARVSANFVREIGWLVKVTAGDTEISTTAEHPFWVVEEGGWVEAAELMPGDSLLQADGGILSVTSVRFEPSSALVYNIAVEGPNTFFVSDGEVLVHNKGGFGALRAGILAKDGTRILSFTKHGVNRAIGDAAKRAGTRPQAILDALKNPTKITEGVDKLGRPFKVFKGTNARVVVNPETGKIVSTNPLSGAGALR